MSKVKKLVNKLKAKAKKAATPKPSRRSKPKAPYNAAGYGKDGAMLFIDTQERKRQGRVGYPWSKPLKAKMLKALDGKRSIREMVAEVDRLAS